MADEFDDYKPIENFQGNPLPEGVVPVENDVGDMGYKVDGVDFVLADAEEAAMFVDDGSTEIATEHQGGNILAAIRDGIDNTIGLEAGKGIMLGAMATFGMVGMTDGVEAAEMNLEPVPDGLPEGFDKLPIEIQRAILADQVDDGSQKMPDMHDLTQSASDDERSLSHTSAQEREAYADAVAQQAVIEAEAREAAALAQEQKDAEPVKGNLTEEQVDKIAQAFHDFGEIDKGEFNDLVKEMKNQEMGLSDEDKAGLKFFEEKGIDTSQMSPEEINGLVDLVAQKAGGIDGFERAELTRVLQGDVEPDYVEKNGGYENAKEFYENEIDDIEYARGSNGSLDLSDVVDVMEEHKLVGEDQFEVTSADEARINERIAEIAQATEKDHGHQMNKPVLGHQSNLADVLEVAEKHGLAETNEAAEAYDVDLKPSEKFTVMSSEFGNVIQDVKDALIQVEERDVDTPSRSTPTSVGRGSEGQQR